jgi:Mycothiol maleylpyruvate isomerase N-terminal domain
MCWTLLPSSDVAVQVERYLDWIRRLSDALVDDVRTRSTDEWDGQTNCPPWRVRDLAAHIVSSGEGFVDHIRCGLDGSVEPPQDTEAAQRRRPALEAADCETVAVWCQACQVRRVLETDAWGGFDTSVRTCTTT